MCKKLITYLENSPYLSEQKKGNLSKLKSGEFKTMVNEFDKTNNFKKDKNSINAILDDVLYNIKIQYCILRYEKYRDLSAYDLLSLYIERKYKKLVDADLVMLYIMNDDKFALNVLFSRGIDILEFQVRRFSERGILKVRIEELWHESFLEAIKIFDPALKVDIRVTTNLIFVNKAFRELKNNLL